MDAAKATVPQGRRMGKSAFRFRSLVMMAAACLLCLLAYAAGIHGDFLFDDFPNIVQNPPLRDAANGQPDWFAIAFMTGSGQLRRPLSMLSFGLNAHAFGMNAAAFKIVNVAIHLANGLWLFALLRRLLPFLLPATRSASATGVALLASAVWLLHPLHVSSVLYIVQRMNLLAAMFVLIGLLCYVEGRVRMLRGERGLLVALSGLCVFGLLAVLCKENGALIFPYALAIEWFGLRFAAPPAQRRRLVGFFLATVGLPCALFIAYLAMHPEMLAYTRNGFTLYTRLLSQARVVCDYLLWIVLPLPAFMGMYHDDIAVSGGLLAPPTTLLSIAFLAGLVALAWRYRARQPALALGVAWFFVGHSLESTIFPLELVFEHRNYLPMVGPLLAALCMASAALARQPRLANRLALAVLVALATTTALRAYDWRNALALALADVDHHPRSSRSQYEAGRAIAADGARRGQFAAVRARAIVYMQEAARLDPLQVFPGVAQILLRGQEQATPRADIEELAQRLRGAQSNEQANPFLELLVTASNGKLALSADDVATLFDAAVQNPRWRPQVRAMMYNDYGAYRFNIAADHEGGMQLTRSAAAIDPRNAYFELNLAKMALAIGEHELAREHLARARRIDTLDQHRAELETLEDALGP